MSVYAYIRVSSELQDYASQKSIIDDYAVSQSYMLEDVFTITVSSRKSRSERGIDDAVKTLKRGDILLVSELSRLSRSMIETLPVLQAISKRGIVLHVIKQNLVIKDIENDMVSKIVCSSLAMAAEMERQMISERTKAGLKAAKERGVKLGNPNLHLVNRKKKQHASSFVDRVRPVIAPMIKAGMTQRAKVDSLNAANIPTSRGGDWKLITLQRVLKQF